MYDKTITIVKIGGRDYRLSGTDSEEYIHSVAIYVNRKLEAIQAANPKLDLTMVATLTAINLADELLKERAAHHSDASGTPLQSASVPEPEAQPESESPAEETEIIEPASNDMCYSVPTNGSGSRRSVKRKFR